MWWFPFSVIIIAWLSGFDFNERGQQAVWVYITCNFSVFVGYVANKYAKGEIE